MPSIAAFHPQIVHFVIALLIVGVVFRWISLTGRLAFTGPAAATLIFLGTLAAVTAAKSGLDAHGPVERIPGARAAVQRHEEWGLRARNVFLGVAALEVLALGLAAARSKRARLVAAASAVAGLAGIGVLYQAADYGADLVYEYAGGVGTKSGDPDDVGRLLLAGLYNQALIDRKAGKAESAAALIDSAAQRFPDDLDVQLMQIESMIADRQDPSAALTKLAALPPPQEDRLRVRAGLLKVSVHQAAGDLDAARRELTTLASAFPNSQQVKTRVKELDAAR